MSDNNFLKEAIDSHLEDENSSRVYWNKRREEQKPLKTEAELTAFDWKCIAENQERAIISHYAHDFITEWRAGDSEDDYGLEYEEHYISIRNLDNKDVKFFMYACPVAMRKCSKCHEKIIGYEIFSDTDSQPFDSFDEFAAKNNLPVGWQDDHHWDEAKQYLCSESKKKTYQERYDEQPAWYRDELTRADGHFPPPRADY